MGRRRRNLWIPESAKRIKAIILFLLSTHPAGLAVLSGRCEYPSANELAEMIACSKSKNTLGVRVQGGEKVPEAQQKVENLEKQKSFFDILEKHGGRARMAEVILRYAETYPKEYQILLELGNRGKFGSLSLEVIANKHNMDSKTLRNLRDRIIEEIAMGVVFYGEDFTLFD